MLREWLSKALLAVRWGEAAVLERLLTEKGVGAMPCCLRGCRLIDIRDATSGYSSMLHMAVESQLVDVTKVLLAKKPNILCYDCFGSTPLGK